MNFWTPFIQTNQISKTEELNNLPQVLKTNAKKAETIFSKITTRMHATGKDAAIPSSNVIWRILYYAAIVLIVGLFVAMLYFYRYERDMGFPLINTAILILLMIVTLYPVLNTVAYSFSSGNAASRGKIGLIPQEFTTKSYRDIMDNYMLGAAWISVAKTVLTTVLNLFWTGMLAFTLTRKEYVLARPITLIMVLTMYVNAGLIPNFLLISQTLGLKNELQLDLTLARGLNYYTGAIFEVKALDVQIGSITGGGRYDNLTGIFGMPGISGVGISFGVDRIFDVLNALDCYPKDAVNGTQLLFINFGEKETAYCLPFVAKAREAGIRTEIFPDSSKMKKQMSYANAKQIPFVALAGENEIAEGKLTLKNMESGEQQLVTIDDLITIVK